VKPFRRRAGVDLNDDGVFTEFIPACPDGFKKEFSG